MSTRKAWETFCVIHPLDPEDASMISRLLCRAAKHSSSFQGRLRWRIFGENLAAAGSICPTTRSNGWMA